MIQLKSAREIDVMAAGGKILAGTLRCCCASAVRPGITTQDLDRIAEEFIREPRGRDAGIQGAVRFSRQRLHLDQRGDRARHSVARSACSHEGDIVSLDVGVRYKGLFTDAAITVPVGDDRRRVEATAGGDQAVARGGDRGGQAWATTSVTSGRRAGGGRGGRVLGRARAGGPRRGALACTRSRRCPTTASPSAGTKLVPGLTIAIEPMVNVGGHATKTLTDKWTIVTADAIAVGALRAHGGDHGRTAPGC